MLAMVLAVIMITTLTACSAKTIKNNGQSSNNSQSDFVEIKPSPDKYTWYIKNYVGKNCASIGKYSSWNECLYDDSYGYGSIKFIIIADDNSYVDPSDKESLKNYVVTAQNIEPNTELKLVFLKRDDGTEYDSLIESQSIQEIELYVKCIYNKPESNS